MKGPLGIRSHWNRFFRQKCLLLLSYFWLSWEQKHFLAAKMIPTAAWRKGPVLVCLFFFSALSFAAPVPQVCHQNNCVTVEVVSKVEDMQRGLMYRKSLGQQEGMLFIFPDDGIHLFWMKNMSFALDIIWIDKKGRVVFIAHNIPSCQNDSCPIYASDKLSRYVLELNSGYAALHDWKVGGELHFLGL